jgi:hypothetical protein
MKKISSAIALICIFMYVGAVLFAAYRMYRGIEQQRETALRELDGLAELIARNSVTDESRRMIGDRIKDSGVLEGIIVTGSFGDSLVFEKEPGKAVLRGEGNPVFIRRFGVAGLPARQVDVTGLRNVNIYSAYNMVRYRAFAGILKQSLVLILGALAVAFLTLIINMTIRPKAEKKPGKTAGEVPVDYGEDENFDDEFNAADSGRFTEPDDFGDIEGFNDPEDIDEGEDAAGAKGSAEPDDFALGDFLNEDDLSMPGEDPGFADFGEMETKAEPKGLYSPKSGLGWEDYITDRLSSELHRCASAEQDLVVMLLECGKNVSCDDALYKRFADEALAFFDLKDLSFERGRNGVALVIPDMTLDQGIARAGEFHSRILKNLAGHFADKTELRAGLSSRSGRLVNAERLLLEASSALEKAESQPIVAFRSNPEKYREFIKKRL